MLFISKPIQAKSPDIIMDHPTPSANRIQQILDQDSPRRRGVFIAMLVVALAIIAGFLLFPADNDKPLQYVTREVSRGDINILGNGHPYAGASQPGGCRQRNVGHH